MMSEWQPIETAPRDGTKADLWDRGGFRWTNQSWSVHQWSNGKPAGAPCWGPGSSGNPPPNPSHWMPLPAPPTD
jgi:hypothetical protein